MSLKIISPILFLFCVSIHCIYGEEASYGVSENPGAVNITPGTGAFGERLKIPKNSGVQFGGVYLGDFNTLLHGGHGTTGNSSLILDLSIDLKKAIGWPGAYFGVEFLQFNGQPTNADAGVVQGYNSLPGDPPLNRSELYQLWIRQELFNKKFSIRIGKTVPTYHFNNVSKPVPTDNPAVSIPSVTGLIYTPVFVNPTLLGAIGWYYNSVYGAVVTIAPTSEAYVNIGFYSESIQPISKIGKITVTIPKNVLYFRVVAWTSQDPSPDHVTNWIDLTPGKLYTLSIDQLVPTVLMAGSGC